MPAAEAAGRAALAAVAFHTRLPLGRLVALDGDDVARAGPLFPLVGAGIGALVGAVAVGLAGPLPALAAAGIAVAVGALATGALHLDALADTADALGGRSRERALEIMRDHRIGSYGAVALALDLLVKASALGALAGRPHALPLALAAGACSRAAALPLAAALPYARATSGTASSLTARTTALRAGAGVAVAAALAVGAGRLDGLAVLGAAAAVTLLLGVAYRLWLGGVTGDALGAASELAETAGLCVAAALV